MKLIRSIEDLLKVILSYVLASGGTFILLFVIWMFDIDITKQKSSSVTTVNERCKALLVENDSLKQELFNVGVELARYEATLDHMKETDPVTAKKFETYLDNETE